MPGKASAFEPEEVLKVSRQVHLSFSALMEVTGSVWKEGWKSKADVSRGGFI
jgi:hypothetical protein